MLLNIWIVNPFDGLPGESLRAGRYAFLSRTLANMGHKVTWWSSNFYHATKRFRNQGQASIEMSDNLRIILLRTPRYHKNISLQRVWNHYVYARQLKAQAANCQETPNVIIASSPPLLAANTAMNLAKRLGSKGIVDIQDIWPEQFEVAIPKNLRPIARAFLLPLRRFASRTYDQADAITAVSHTFLQRALSASRDKNKKSMMLPLGVDLSLHGDCLGKPADDMRYIKRNENEFWAIYIGTIGKSYDIKTILDVAERLSYSYPSIKFLIAGSGPDYAKMRNHAGKKELANVIFTGLLDYHQLVHLLDQCDIGLNAFAAGAKNALPNKLFDYLATGLPIINSVKGELESLIKREHIGLQYEAEDAESLAKAIVGLHHNPQERWIMGQRARKLAEERFDMNKEYPKFESFIHEVLSK